MIADLLWSPPVYPQLPPSPFCRPWQCICETSQSYFSPPFSSSTPSFLFKLRLMSSQYCHLIRFCACSSLWLLLLSLVLVLLLFFAVNQPDQFYKVLPYMSLRPSCQSIYLTLIIIIRANENIFSYFEKNCLLSWNLLNHACHSLFFSLLL